MIPPVGTLLGVFVGATVAKEVHKRGREEEKKNLEKYIATIEERLSLETERVEQAQREAVEHQEASVVLENAKKVLESKIGQLEKEIELKTGEALSEKKSREQLLISLKTRVNSILAALSNNDMDTNSLARLVSRMFGEHLESGRALVVTDENSISLSETDNMHVKLALASPNRMRRLAGAQSRPALQARDQNTSSLMEDLVSSIGSFQLPSLSDRRSVEHQA
mmetsp:Transcript_11988/g.30589  ORF Transcript_11988/g.30589 Transcript_11988/m.30589 type:complete len:223 (-) Transcript_11988:355-1023(-)